VLDVILVSTIFVGVVTHFIILNIDRNKKYFINDSIDKRSKNKFINIVFNINPYLLHYELLVFNPLQFNRMNIICRFI